MRYTAHGVEVEAWIESDGEELPEHRETAKLDEKTGRANALHEAFLECEEGKTFSITYRCVRTRASPSAPCTEMKINLDGRPVSGSILTAEDDHDEDHWVSTMFIEEEGKTLEADFSFATLAKTDDPNEAELSGRDLDNLCTIEVIFSQGTTEEGDGLPSTTPSHVGLVHEKELKIGSTIEPANAREASTPPSIIYFTPAERDADICRFVWKYHTRASLDIMGITEPAPVAPAAEVNAPAAGSSRRTNGPPADHDEVVVLSSKRSKPGDSRAVKQERTGSGSKDAPIMVSDVDPPRKRPRGSGTKAEVIDLTDD